MNQVQSPNVSQNHYPHSNPIPSFENPAMFSNNQDTLPMQTSPQPTVEVPTVDSAPIPADEQPTRIPAPVTTHPKSTTTIDRHFASVRTKRNNPSTRSVPSYMSTTLSFKNRHLEDKPATENTSRSRPMNTIKRPIQSRIPRYKHTRINTTENKEEMGPGEAYIPLAARIKIFEKNLGNGLVAAPKQPLVPHKPTLAKSPFLLTRQRAYLNRNQAEQATQPPTTTRSTSSGAQQRIHNPLKSRAIQSDDTSYPAAKRQRKMDQKGSVQPFRFATQERALHHRKGSQARLDTWKGKEHTVSEGSRSTNRLANEEQPRNPRKRKQEDALA
ncbi:hypothetical protein CLU79DRAFT_765419 [Phycomyces nitens]|nr:hypothetical protein CLU79DRAFT_765419 [Phycomyces nitens]